MAPIKNGRAIFSEIPEGLPDPTRTIVYDQSQTIDLDNVPLKGGILIKTVALSIDPYMRSRLRDASIKQRFDAFTLGQPVTNFGVGRVLRSEDPQIKAGDHIYRAELPFQEYTVLHSTKDVRILKNEEKLPWTLYVGVAGMPGKTAWFGWKEYASPRIGDVAFVTAAGGPVGSFVIQLAKANGCKVIASAGTEEKTEFAKSCGADIVFNYKTADTTEVLQKEGPVNIYWDNVGGETLDAALANSALEARFIECGMIAYASGRNPHVKNLPMIVAHDLKIFGFIVSTLAHKYEEQFYQEVPKLIALGMIKYKEDVRKGLQHTGQTLLDVLTGANNGKAVISLE